jgi:hypothetical protein
MKPHLLSLLSLSIACGLLAAPGQALSAPQANSVAQEEDKIPTAKLVVRPAPEPRTALKYQLLPPLMDRRPGNAAVLYGTVNAESSRLSDGDFWDKISEWIETPLEQLPRKEMRETLPDAPLSYIERGARCEFCDWQLPLRDEPFFEILLPMVQQSRNYGRLVAAKARLHIAEGEIDEAVHALQTGYALARHVGQERTIVNGLVGIAITGIMNEQLEALIQQPGAPNFYWALTSLPQPLVDMRPGFEAEMNMLYLTFPELRNVDASGRGLAYWQSVVQRTADSVAKWSDDGGSQYRLLATVLALKGYPEAKRQLIAQGRSAEAVEAMPVPQVVVLHTVETYEEFRDETFKWFFVPYWQGLEGMQRAEQRLMHEAPNREIIPVASLLLPAIRAARLAMARGERDLAMLRAVEALRIYAAANEGQWPARLEDITQVPVPIDPIHGKPFLYSRDGKTAVLESPIPDGRTRMGKRIEITVADGQ